jgi:hypothetical protein
MTAAAAPAPRNLTLAVHPVTEGFGWVLFENPLRPFQWRSHTVFDDKNARCLRGIEKLMELFEPHTLVLEDFESKESKRSGRVRKLCRALVLLAQQRSMDIAVYTREQVRFVFSSYGAVSRQQIAEAVARHVPAIGHRLPAKRKSWEKEDPRIALFMAAALVLTHYRLDADYVLETLSGEGTPA